MSLLVEFLVRNGLMILFGSTVVLGIGAIWEFAREKIVDQFLGELKRLRLTSSEMAEISNGELCVALVPTKKERETAFVILADVGGRRVRAEKLLARMSDRLADGRPIKSVRGKHDVPYTLFDRLYDEPNRQVCFAADQNLFVVTDHAFAMEAVLDRRARGHDRSLATSPAYNEILKHCQNLTPQRDAEIRWFVELEKGGWIASGIVIPPSAN